MFLWVALPYLAIATFIVGHIWRYRRDQFTWTTRSSQLLEHKWLRIGGPLFHLGLLAVIGGHVLGILVPKAVTEAVGVNEHMYHTVSVVMGSLAGLAMTTGLAILIIRRASNRRVRVTTRTWDIIVLTLLGFMVVTGMYNTTIENLIQGGYDYRETVGPWFRSLFLLDPDPALMSGAEVPLSFQLHAIGGWLVFIVWPFSRLVHAWSVPIAYLRRPPIVYRSRASSSVRAGAFGGVRRSTERTSTPS
jgi:nitrate reductase gamma subunit